MGKTTLRRKLYDENKGAKVGSELICPVCGNRFVKKQYSQAFCSGKCKDRFWNDKGDRHSAGYQERYNSEHPDRLHYVADAIAKKMGLGYSNADMEEREAIEEYLRNPEFKAYVNDDNDGSWDEHQANVSLATMLRNFRGDDAEDFPDY